MSNRDNILGDGEISLARSEPIAKLAEPIRDDEGEPLACGIPLALPVAELAEPESPPPPLGHEPFLKAVLDDPDADAPRLVYADWLEEHGDPRADFIRVQCELAQLADEAPQHDALSDRRDRLLRMYGESWRAEIPEWARAYCEFTRGFVSEVTIFRPWRRHFGPELSRLAPVEKVTLKNLHIDPESFTDAPGVRHLNSLVILDEQLEYDQLKALMHSRAALAPLRCLDIMWTEFRDAGALMVALSPHLERLRRLELKACSLSPRAVHVLTHEARSLHNLNWLDLSNNDLNDDSIWTLANAASMRGLTHLFLNSNKITNQGLSYLADSHCLANLTDLELDGNVFGDASIPLIVERFSKLRHLSVAGNFLTIGGAMRLREHFGPRVELGVPGSR